jgi:hypothetical protein
LKEEATAIAHEHGIQIPNLKENLGLRVEFAVQNWLMSSPFWIDTLNKLYSCVHTIPATLAFMVYFFKYAPPPVFRRVWRTLVAFSLIAFVVFTSWPAMPPRLLPEKFGFVDTVHKNKHASAWTTNKSVWYPFVA